MRKSIVAGNWKMNGKLAANAELVNAIIEGGPDVERVEVLLCPPGVYLSQVSDLITGTALRLGAQNASAHVQGAYTGEVSLGMLAEFGVGYVIVGHSERRALFAETDEQVAEKFRAVIAAGMRPVLCVGETLDERDAGRTLDVVGHQLKTALDTVAVSAIADAVIAYEPVWAIGTGRSATPAQAQDVHQALRAVVAGYELEAARQVRILYGGSVNAANAAELFAQPDIDGGLVGGASLKAQDFLAICSAAANAKIDG